MSVFFAVKCIFSLAEAIVYGKNGIFVTTKSTILHNL